MQFPVLQEIGLTPNEAQIYEALLAVREAGAGGISVKAKIHRRNVYDALNRMVEKGVVFQVFGNHEVTYRPVDPGKLMELIKEKEERLSAIMPTLETMYRSERRAQESYIYKGLEGFKNYLRDILRVGKDVDFIGAKGGWFDPRLKPFTTGFLREADRLGIRYRHLFDYEVKKQLPDVMKAVKQPYKFLPKKYSTGSAIDVFGDHVVTFTGIGLAQLDDEITLFVVVSQGLADSYRTWLQFMWDQLPEEKQDS